MYLYMNVLVYMCMYIYTSCGCNIPAVECSYMHAKVERDQASIAQSISSSFSLGINDKYTHVYMYNVLL